MSRHAQHPHIHLVVKDSASEIPVLSSPYDCTEDLAEIRRLMELTNQNLRKSQDSQGYQFQNNFAPKEDTELLNRINRMRFENEMARSDSEKFVNYGVGSMLMSAGAAILTVACLAVL